MKVMQVNVLAGSGSTGKIMADVNAELLRRGDDSLMCYGRKHASTDAFKFCSEPEAAMQKILNRVGALMYGGNLLSTSRLTNRIGRECPDIVHLHCINGFCVNIYRLLRYLAVNRIPTVVTHHAEFFYTGNCGHALDCLMFTDNPGCGSCPTPRAATGAMLTDRSARAWQKMHDAFGLFDSRNLVFTAVSPWLKERSMLSRVVNRFECHVVENGLDDSVFRLTSQRAAFRKMIPQCRNHVVAHVTASFSDSPDNFKGGDRIIELARLMPETTFVVAASYSDVKGPLPENVYLHGRTAGQQELAALYNAADATVIASKRETFSMVVAESLCCGTPVAGFRAGGPESIAIAPYCDFVDRADGTEALKRSVENMISRKFDPATVSAEAREAFSRKVMAQKYIEVYKSLLSKR